MITLNFPLRGTLALHVPAGSSLPCPEPTSTLALLALLQSPLCLPASTCPSCWLCLPHPLCPTQTICWWAPSCPSLPVSTSHSQALESAAPENEGHSLTDCGPQAALLMTKNILISASPPLLKLSSNLERPPTITFTGSGPAGILPWLPTLVSLTPQYPSSSVADCEPHEQSLCFARTEFYGGRGSHPLCVQPKPSTCGAQ